MLKLQERNGSVYYKHDLMERLSKLWKALKWKDSGVGWSYTLSEDYEMLWKQVNSIVNERPQQQHHGLLSFDR
jgi:hypothetical protein